MGETADSQRVPLVVESQTFYGYGVNVFVRRFFAQPSQRFALHSWLEAFGGQREKLNYETYMIKNRENLHTSIEILANKLGRQVNRREKNIQILCVPNL